MHKATTQRPLFSPDKNIRFMLKAMPEPIHSICTSDPYPYGVYTLHMH